MELNFILQANAVSQTLGGCFYRYIIEWPMPHARMSNACIHTVVKHLPPACQGKEAPTLYNRDG